MARRKKSRPQVKPTRQLESLEARQVMSANPLLGGPTLTQHAFEEAPTLIQHAVEEQTPEYDFRIDHDTLFADLDNIERRIEQTLNDAHALTGRDAVSAKYGFDGSGQTVAVIDSGIAYRHFALGGGLGADYRVVGGYDFTENDADIYDDGTAGSHGTHVAGIVGASGGAHEGVAPGVDLVGLRVFDDVGNGFFSWVEQALQWVHDNQNTFENPITAVNLSLGTEFNGSGIPGWAMLENEFAQLEADGIFISVSAGNSYQNFLENGLSYPAASPHVIPVLATNNDGSLAFFSQRHERGIAAPGRSITSTVPDYAANDADSIDNDYLSLSGTSMAAPYVAGASVLIREAFEFVGQTGLNQWDIYDHIVSTADTFFDSASQTTYNRLNIEAAIDAILPADDFGSSVATAHNLGVMNAPTGPGTQSVVSGVITTLDDADYFSFTAGATGTVTVEATNITHALDVQWGGGWTVNADGSYSIDVTAGQQYTFGLSSTGGLGYYDLTVNLEAAETFTPTEWGTIGPQETRTWQPAGAEQWFRVTAGRTGYFTAEALNAQGGSATIAVYDAQQNLISTPGARADALATAGQELLIRVTGDAASYDVRMTNALDVSGGMATLVGTAGDDTISFTAGDTHTVELNGVSYSFAASDVQIDAGAGADDYVFSGSAASEQVTIEYGSSEVTADGYRVAAAGYQTSTHFGNGGDNIAHIHGSDGDDTYIARVDRASITSGDRANHAVGFGEVWSYAGQGNDIATLFDSAGDDELRAYSDRSVFTGEGFRNIQIGFDETWAYATTGYDRSYMFDTAGDDTYRAHHDRVFLFGEGYLNFAANFDETWGYSTTGNDLAQFYDTPGDDEFRGSHDRAFLFGEGYLNYAAGFSNVYAYASGGNDIAKFYDSAGDDEFRGYSDRALLFGDGFLNYATGFDQSLAYATSGGNDIAKFYDSAGDDEFRGYHDRALLFGDGFLNYATGFDQSLAYAVNGGTDVAKFYDSAGDDEFRGYHNRATLFGAGYLNYVVEFEQNWAYSTAGNDKAQLYANSTGDSVLNISDTTYLYGTGYLNLASSFGQVVLHPIASPTGVAVNQSTENDAAVGLSAAPKSPSGESREAAPDSNTQPSSNQSAVEMLSAADYQAQDRLQTEGVEEPLITEDESDDEIAALDLAFEQVGGVV